MAGSVPDGVATSVERVLAALPADATRREGRFILGIAGSPASGKSTLAVALCDALSGGASPGGAGEIAAIAALDGFHYDDRVLNARGHRPRKGAPFTFDVEGYVAILGQLAAPTLDAVAIPIFDRDLELSRAAAAVVEPHHRIMITEGNYLLLDDKRWHPVRDRLDFSVFLDVPPEELRRRLMDRWLGHGYPLAKAKEKTEANDLVNARLVATTSSDPNLRIGASN